MSNGAQWFDTLFLIILENHGWSQVQKTNLVSWFSVNGTVFWSWDAAAHPSGPNYRALMSGNYWSSNEFDDVHRPNIGDQVPCFVASFKGQPAQRHNPFLDMHAAKAASAGSIDTFQGIYYLGMDDMNNAHSGPDDERLQIADRNVMEAIGSIVTPSRAGRYLFFTVFDEAFGFDWFSNHVFAAMAGPMIPRGKSVHSPISHFNFARLLYDNWSIDAPPEMMHQGNVYAGQKLWDLP